jgi:hypothetical protein
MLLVGSLQEGLEHADTVVIGHRTDAFMTSSRGIEARHHIVDLAGIAELADLPNYRGICW